MKTRNVLCDNDNRMGGDGKGVSTKVRIVVPVMVVRLVTRGSLASEDQRDIRVSRRSRDRLSTVDLSQKG